MKNLVEKFQCPGCVFGSDTECGNFNYSQSKRKCASHVLGTMIGLGNSIALGMPKGFNKPGFKENGSVKNRIDIRLWGSGENPGWDHLNVPVWAMEEDGYLFVRTFAPRINYTWVDVVKNGSLEMVPSAINVKKFVDNID